MSKKVAVIIPTLNEAHGIGPTIKEVLSFLDKPCILVVDGGSTDGTLQIASNLGAIVIQCGKGEGKAISRALQWIEKAPNYQNNTKWLVIIDADFSYPAIYIKDMILILEKRTDTGMVTGSQGSLTYLASTSFSDHLRKLLTIRYYFIHHVFVMLHRLLIGVYLKDPLTGLRVIRLDCIRSFRPHALGFGFQLELNKYITRKGYKIVEVPIVARKRIGGTTKFTPLRWFEVLFRMIIIAMRNVPAIQR